MQTTISLVLLSFVLFSCTNNTNSTIKETAPHTDSLITDTGQQKEEKPVTGIVPDSEKDRSTGDTPVDNNGTSSASLSFNDFKTVNIDRTSKAKLDLSSNKQASNYRTKLTEAYQSDTPNFAGHYTFVYWGCGTSCQNGLLIDRQTGKIYNVPMASLGYEYYAESRMLLVNPPDPSVSNDECSYCKPVMYVLDEKTKTFIEIKPTK